MTDFVDYKLNKILWDELKINNTSKYSLTCVYNILYQFIPTELIHNIYSYILNEPTPDVFIFYLTHEQNKIIQNNSWKSWRYTHFNEITNYDFTNFLLQKSIQRNIKNLLRAYFIWNKYDRSASSNTTFNKITNILRQSF
jgi:hypothetical protein